jgi:para-nitrobenzyl esterase
MTDGSFVETDTASGRLRGRRNDGIETFRGVPYAAPPIGANRFARPAPVTPWAGTRDATAPAPVAPQLPGRLRLAMGDFDAAQSEDCLSVTVWTPAADHGKRPVLVWLHGGAYMTGGGALDWYSGARLAREGDIVVVGVNYRLGALGYLHHPRISGGNLGLLDQHAAFEWVRDNIAGFGGDPDNVTAWGQSAGAHSIALLLTRPSSRPLFHRAILQSAPLALMPQPAEAAAEVAEQWVHELGLVASDPRLLDALRALPVGALLKAQGALAERLGRAAAGSGNPAPPFAPIGDGEMLPMSDAIPEAFRGAATLKDVMIGTTREEMAVFFAFNPAMQALTRPPLSDAEIARLRARRPAGNASQLFGDHMGSRMFGAPSLAWAEHAVAADRRAFVYRFDWASPDTRLAACHCLDLPFVFGTREAFAAAPMLARAAAEEVDALSASMRAAWIGFTRSGDPGGAALPPWPSFEASRRAMMLFDRVCGAVGDIMEPA